MLNVFFGPTVNAARAICSQVETALTQCSTNFQMAVNPQITKNYAVGNLTDMHTLLFRSSKFSFYLIFIFALPLLYGTEYVLSLWLVNVPDYTADFVRIMLCTILVNSTAQPIAIAAAATGRVKVYQSVVGGILLLILPFSYIALKLGYNANSVYVVHFAIVVLSCIVRLIIVRPMIGLSLKLYAKRVCIPILKVMAIVLVLVESQILMTGLSRGSVWSLCLIFLTSVLGCYLCGLEYGERLFISTKIKSVFVRLGR